MAELKKEAPKKVERATGAKTVKPTPKVTKPRIERNDYVSTLYMAHPYQDKMFDNGIVTTDVIVDSWVESQVKAGILKAV